MRGQAIVEFALVLPVLMLVLLGVIGVFYLDLSTRKMQQGIDVLAQLAAHDDSWRTAVASENARTGCHANPVVPEVTYPDRNHRRMLLTWHCRLETRWIFDGLPITVSAEAVRGND